MITALHSLLRLGWFVRRPRTFGAHGLALTPEGSVVLVKLRYAPGWRLPGELREEIGMISHGAVTLAAELEERPDFKRDLAALLIIRDVRYRPHRWSWEVEAICEAPLDRLPADLSPRAATWLEALRGKV